MKIQSILLAFTILAVLFILGSCAEKVVNTPMPEAVVENVEEVAEPEQLTVPTAAAPIVDHERMVVGSYRSVKGVMDKLSCHCGNGGYVETPAGETVAVCFDQNTIVNSCDVITVTGVVSSHSIESNGACPAGMMSILTVETYKIGE